MNLLFFHLEMQFGADIILVANNEVDLKSFLESCGYRDIEFSDLQEQYGKCNLKSNLGRELAKCFYITKV